MPRFLVFFVFATTLALSACVEDLDPGEPPVEDEDPTAEHFTFEDEGNGVTLTLVDATHEEDWVYLALAGSAEVRPDAPETSTGWDLGFRRSDVKVNGGASGLGGVEVAILEGADFSALTQAPAEGWTTDQADSNGDGVPEYVFGGLQPWYDYDFSTHILSAADKVYVVKNVFGVYYKLQFVDYYHDGISGMPSFRFAEIEAPEPPSGWVVDASDPEAWVYLDLLAGEEVEISDPANDDSWDLAAWGAMLRTNSGASGPGLGGAYKAEQTVTFENLTSTDTIGFTTDQNMPIPGPPGAGNENGNPVLSAWWIYDPINHTLSSARDTFVVRTANGQYVKLRIEDATDQVFVLSVEPITRSPLTHSISVDASDAATPVHFDLRNGNTVSVADALTDLSWDLRLQRTQLATNSGTSGSGSGGAIDPALASLEAVTTAPTEGWSIDEDLTLPAGLGGTTFSGSPVLNGWFDYTNEVVTPGDRAYLARTATGGAVRLKVTDWVDGVFSIDYSYAGAGQTDFGTTD